MTTIIASLRHGMMVGDGRISMESGMIVTEKSRKLIAITHNNFGKVIFGVAGSADSGLEFFSVVDRTNKVAQLDNEFSLQNLLTTISSGLQYNGIPYDHWPSILMLHKGGVFYSDSGKNWEELGEGYGAIGSGSKGAIAAFKAGATPEQAVVIASSVDINTNDVLQVEKL